MKFFVQYRFLSFVLILLMLPIFSISSFSGINAEPAFHNISLTTAKQLAGAEGKNIFVEFYANWCVPCKWMEETTFADVNVQNELQENYIAVRVDIDDFDGFALKQYYDVTILPTILILDENGRSLERKEQSLTAEMLLQMLQSQPEVARTAPVNTAPGVKEQEITEKSPELEIESNTEKNTEVNINHATVKTNTYRVQVGVFTDYANTDKMVKQLRGYSEEPIIVLNDYLNGKIVFRILIGDFENKEDAEKLKNHLWQNYGIDGFVK